MKNFKIIFISVAALLMVVSCNLKESVESSLEWGTVDFDCTTLDWVEQMTRTASVYSIPSELIPSADDLLLEITGSYIDPDTASSEEFAWGPQSFSDYRESLPMIYSGESYSARFYSGSAGAEGDTAAYFSGSVDFAVVARDSLTLEVSVGLTNSIICVESDELFDGYYSDATFTVATSSGGSFDFSLPSSRIVFVEAGASLTLSGSATKRSSGESVTFNATQIGSTSSRTMSRITITTGSIGGQNITITLDDTVTEVEQTTIELNPR